VSYKAVHKWFEYFCGGAESTEDKQHSSHLSTSTTDEHVKNDENDSIKQKRNNLRHI
jgi:hypothetical protein